VVAAEHSVEQPLVWIGRSAELVSEPQIEVNRLARALFGRLGLQDNPEPWFGINPQNYLVRLWPRRSRHEGKPRRPAEEYPHLGSAARQRLPGTDEERNSGPPPVVDVEPRRHESFRSRVRRYTGDPAVPVVLTAHTPRGVGVGHRTEYLDLLVPEAVCTGADRRFHRHQGGHLQEVILHNVT
jgi:hypothetical protein